METLHSKSVLLCFTIRTSRYGYAAFAGPEQLLDYGSGEIVSHETGNAVGVRRARFLFAHFQPDDIVLRWSPHRNAVRRERPSKLVRYIRREAWTRGVPSMFIGGSEVKGAFSTAGRTTQYGIAATLARMFPELQWKLPPKRKNWEPEPRFMIVLDAIAAGIAYWRRESQGNAAAPPQSQ